MEQEFITEVNFVFSEVKDSGGSFCRCYPINGLTNLRCREDVLLKLQTNEEIQKKFKLNVLRINRWWYSVALVPKEN